MGGILASVACGAIGSYVVVKRIGYLAGGIAHAVLGGMGIAYYLGRSPIADAAWNAMEQARDYCDLEFDLENGKRGSRMRGVSIPLAELTGAEAGMVVNNCAAALLLMVTGLAGNKPTAISRGQIVEIGGGFRLPKMMEASGSKLMEIGTTNRTHLYDYEEAAQEAHHVPAAAAGLSSSREIRPTTPPWLQPSKEMSALPVAAVFINPS